ncbi:MAG: large repetitive protein, partial [Frankiales bacterium]|nr:large repetitive protein [Frankiales bacterium]
MHPSSLARRGRTVTVTGLVVAVVAGQVALTAVAARAATTFTVTTTSDVPATFGACGNPAVVTPPSPLSLREATCLANNVHNATIIVPSGTYHLTSGELQLGLANGDNATLTGAGAASTVIDAGAVSRVIDLDPNLVGGVTDSISGVTISGGRDTGFGGAGIIAGSANASSPDALSISSSTITGNTVASTATNKPGGGVQFIGGSLTITNSTISNNTAGSSPGSGVIYGAQGVAAGEQLTVTGTTFSGNSTNASASNINIGGALATEASGPANFTVSNDRFVNNTVVGSGTGIAQGAAIFSQSGTLNVTGSTFTGNSVSGGSSPAGGAISVLGGSAVAHYNRFTGNVAPTGSALSLGVGSGATVDATDNWWGCNSGPGIAGCDTVAGGPTVSPRLVLTATASPATVVGPNATSTITASLTQDSLGSAIGAAQLGAFAGLPVAWSDPQPGDASVAAASSALGSGAASTTYNSHTSSGPGHVLATLDNGTATATITVNRAPAITSANTAAFTTGSAGSFTVTVSGYPTAAVTKTGTLPSGLTFTDNGNGTATLAGTPSAGTGGAYSIGLTAANGVSPNATQTLTISVSQAPAFSSATSTTFTVGTAGSFSVTTSGTPTPTVTRTGTVPGLTFTDNGNGTATLSGTPSAGAGGVYSLGLTASNGVNPNATQTLTVNVNQAPTVTSNPADQSVNPGSSVTFTAAASGNPTPTVQWQRSIGGSFSNVAGATSPSYTFTAAVGDNGNTYRAVFTNAAGTAMTTASTLTVGSAPTINSANAAAFTVGAAGSFTVTTSGFPNPTLTTAGTLPAWLSFTDNGDGTATLAGTPPAGSGGTYSFTINADNGNTPSDSQAFSLTVDESPVITSADHTTFLVGAAGNFLVTTTAGFPVATTVSETGALPSGVTFTPNGSGGASLAGTPSAG